MFTKKEANVPQAQGLSCVESSPHQEGLSEAKTNPATPTTSNQAVTRV